VSVGFTPTEALEELRRAYRAVEQLQKSLASARQSFSSRELKQLDTDIANAWLISTEIKQRLTTAGKDLKAG
jgi:hypothetical protein